MARKSSKSSDEIDAHDKPIGLADIGRIALPWVLLHKEVLQQLKDVSEKNFYSDSIVRAAAASHLGLNMALGKRPFANHLLGPLLSPDPETAIKRLEPVFDRLDNVKQTTESCLNLYETMIDAMINELNTAIEKDKNK